MKQRLFAFALACACAASPATAAVVTQDYSFSVTASGPISSQSGTFTLDYDTVTKGYSLVAINFAIGSTTFTTSNTGVVGDGMGGFTLGGTVGGVGTVAVGSDDFALNDIVGNVQFFYSTVGFNDFGFGGGNDLSITLNNPSAVPEPSTWLMMLVGFGGLALVLRRTKRMSAGGPFGAAEA